MQATKKELQALSKLITKFSKNDAHFRYYPMFGQLHYCSNNQMLMVTNGITMVIVSHATPFSFEVGKADFHSININDLNRAIYDGREEIKTNVIDMDDLIKSCNLTVTPVAASKVIDNLLSKINKCSTPNPVSGISFSLDSLNDALQTMAVLSYNERNHIVPVLSVLNQMGHNILCAQYLGIPVPHQPFLSNVFVLVGNYIRCSSAQTYYAEKA